VLGVLRVVGLAIACVAGAQCPDMGAKLNMVNKKFLSRYSNIVKIQYETTSFKVLKIKKLKRIIQFVTYPSKALE
jgi:hypothetical protein